MTAARLDQAGVRLADREINRRRGFGFGFGFGLKLRLRLERRVPGRPPGGEADREVGCVAHTSEA